jgi:hypothetical protein
VPLDGDAHGADPEVAGVGERRVRLRLVGPLQRVVVHADEQPGRGPNGPGDEAGERRARGEDSGDPAHDVSIGGASSRHE